MDPVAIVKGIITLAQFIYMRAEEAKVNREQAKRLVERVRQIVTSLGGLEQLPRQRQFIDSLKALELCLKDINKFLEQFNHAKWHKKLFGIISGQKKQEFEHHTTCLAELLPQLNIGLSAQQLIDHEQDKRDREKDRRQDKAMYEAFLLQQKQILREVQKQLTPDDLDAVLGRQMQALEMRLNQQLEKRSASPSSPLLPKEACVNFYEVTCLEKIGEGSFGSIYRGVWHEQSVAVKLIERGVTEADRHQFIREVQVMSRLRNDYVSSFRGACLEPNQLCLLMELAEKGDLQQVLMRESEDFTLALRLQIALDLSKGLHYLHQQGVVHGDIKPKNILINRHSEAKWTDFGLAKTRMASVASLGQISSSQEACWQAPESWVMREGVSAASDVYSFGMVLWYLLTGRQPYVNLSESEIIRRVKSGYREALPQTPRDIPAIYSDWVSLIEACWSESSLRRPHSLALVHRLEAICEEIQKAPVLPPIRPTSSPSGETLYGQGVEAQKAGQLEKAYSCFERASQKQYVKAYTSVGLFALQGLGGVSKNLMFAREQLERGAQGGHSRAMFNLARMYEKGDGIPRDYPTALSWYRKTLEADPQNKEARRKVDLLAQLLERSGEQSGYAMESRGVSNVASHMLDCDKSQMKNMKM